MPDYTIEEQYVGRVAGVDEVGRGPLAGPVVAAAVVFPVGIPLVLAGMLDDSKKLTAEQRQVAYFALISSGLAEIGVGAASVTEISTINILQASLLAMRRAVWRLPVMPVIALIDGNRPPALPCEVRCVIGGDAICLSIAAASIVAKVVRDRAMTRLAARLPHYGWSSNVGYGTAAHRAAITLHGPSRHHRPTFGAVRLHIQGSEVAPDGDKAVLD
jgi:ribonuclease HII